jgi:adenylate cyclase
LIEKAEANDSAYAFVVLDRELYAIAVAPLLAPDPIAWLCPMFRIDNDFAREIQSYTNLEITFLNGAQLFGTTLPNRQAVSEMLRNRTLPPKQLINLPLAGEIFTGYVAPLPAENGNPIALLQRSLDKELAPYLRLERTYLGLALLGLALSGILGLWIARGVSRPVLELAGGAREIAAGNYDSPRPTEAGGRNRNARRFVQSNERRPRRTRPRPRLVRQGRFTSDRDRSCCENRSRSAASSGK